ncbi:MAG: hypothetical protein QOC82_3188 [Frankiaceae bacterium]|nr:hypothetical protein [Frankiaceae bacterium]
MGSRRSARQLLGALLIAAAAAVVVPPTAHADVVTISSDSLRTGWDGSEPGLTGPPVASDGFGQLFARHVDGQVYAEPVVADGVLVVATENNVVYGLDPATGDVMWQTPQSLLGPAWPTTAATCNDLRPNAGVTSTPVVDNGVVYLTAKTWDGSDAANPTYWMHALDIITGAEEPGWPVALAGAPVNDPDHAFQPQMQLQRAGLLMLDGVVYAAFASHCDETPTRGYVMGVRTGATPQLTTIWTTAPTDPVNGQTGIWMSGSGIMSDGSGRMFVATGNGAPPPYAAAAADLTTFGDSVLRLDVQPDGSLRPGDYFTPASAENLNLVDHDFGSGGVVGLPDSFGTPTHPHLAVAAGKDGRFFLLDRDHLGGRAHADGDPGAIGVYGPYRGQFSHPAVWPGAGGWIYTTEAGGPLRSWHAGVDGDGDPVLTMAGRSEATLPFGSGSPVVTSNGADGPDALVWVVSGSTTAQPIGSLQAYDAVPDATGALALRWSAPISTAGKFSVAATDGGRVYVGTRGDDDGGVIYGFGRTAPLPVNAPSWQAGNAPVGQQLGGTIAVSVPADGTAVRLTDADVSGSFGVDASALPDDPIQPGDTVQLPVTFAPTVAGIARGVVHLHAGDTVVAIDLTGYGVTTGLVAMPSRVDLGTVPLELPTTVGIELRNPTAEPMSLTALTSDGGFSIAGAPTLTAAVPAGGALAVRVSVVPTASGPFSGHLSATAGDVTTTVPLTGTGGVALGHLAIDAPSLSAGTVALGQSAPVVVRFTNVGIGPLTVTQASLTGGDFTASPDFAAGVQIRPEETVTETLTFQPRAPGAQAATFSFMTTSGGRPGGVKLTGYGAGTLTRLDASTWRLGGRASIRTHVASLTPYAPNAAGTGIYDRQVHTTGLHATYQAYVGGGTGGSGLTFAILGGGNGPGSVGSAGPGMGVGGLAAVAVTLDTEKDAGDPAADFAGVAVAHAHGRMSYVATKPVGPSLRVGWHTVDVRESNGSLLVSLDGHRLLSVAVALPAQAWVGFTGGTGPSYEWNEVKAATVTVT